MIFNIVGSKHKVEVCQILKIEEIKDKDNIVLADIGDYKVIVKKNLSVGDKGLFFKEGTILSKEFATKQNLFQKSDKNDEKNKKGYLASVKIKTIKFAGIKSEGLFLPIEVLESIGFKKFDELAIGSKFNRIDLFNQVVFCFNSKKLLVKNKNEKGEIPQFTLTELTGQKPPHNPSFHKKVCSVLPVEEVIEIIKLNFGKVTINGERVGSSSIRLQTFTKSLTCACCGAKAVYFRIEKGISDENKKHGGHLELYCERFDGAIDMLTKDHIIPRSKGGVDELENMQTMCYTCNGTKGNNHEKEIEIRETFFHKKAPRSCGNCKHCKGIVKTKNKQETRIICGMKYNSRKKNGQWVSCKKDCFEEK